MKKLILFLLLIVPVMVFAQETAEPGEDNSGTISTIVNLVLGGVGIFLAGAWAKIKSRLTSLKDLVTTLTDALADDNVSPTEVKAISSALKKLVAKG